MPMRVAMMPVRQAVGRSADEIATSLATLPEGFAAATHTYLPLMGLLASSSLARRGSASLEGARSPTQSQSSAHLQFVQTMFRKSLLLFRYTPPG
jgi:hypothetical protein